MAPFPFAEERCSCFCITVPSKSSTSKLGDTPDMYDVAGLVLAEETAAFRATCIIRLQACTFSLEAWESIFIINLFPIGNNL